MSQIKVLKIGSDGIPLEHTASSDDVTFTSFTVDSAGIVLDASGLAMNDHDINGVQDLAFQDPSTGTINQTVGSLIVDNIVAKDRSNVFTTAGDVLFPVISDNAGQVDAFRLPALAGAPSATPTSGGDGYLVWDSTDGKLFAWNGTTWDDLSTVTSAENLETSQYTAEAAIAARDVVYISSADKVSPAQGDTAAKAQVIGLAVASAAISADVQVRSAGILSGFTGLTAASRYYLSAATAGQITSSIPTGTGQTIVQVGYAKSATALQIQIQSLGRRA